MHPAIAELTLEYRCSLLTARVARYALSRRVRSVQNVTALTAVAGSIVGCGPASRTARRVLCVSLDRFIEVEAAKFSANPFYLS